MKLPLRMRRGVPTRTGADWEEAALDTIADGGIASLSIPELARSIGVTKGSFYWHFSSLRDLIDRAVKRWESEDRSALEAIASVSAPAARLQRLFRDAMTAKRGAALFHALSISPSSRTAATLRRVSARRLQFLTDAYLQLGLDSAEAQQRALLAYTAYIGAVQLRAAESPWLKATTSVEEYVDYAARVLIGSARPPSTPPTP